MEQKDNQEDNKERFLTALDVSGIANAKNSFRKFSCSIFNNAQPI
jgi:hypothetical protein